MKIDLRLLITPAAPFVILGFVNLFFWVAGVDANAELVAAMSLAFGVVLGAFFTIGLFHDEVEIGHITIRWPRR